MVVISMASILKKNAVANDNACLYFLVNHELADLIVTSSYIRPPCAVVHNSECGEAGVLNFHSNIINMQGLLQELFKGAYP